MAFKQKKKIQKRKVIIRPKDVDNNSALNFEEFIGKKIIHIDDSTPNAIFITIDSGKVISLWASNHSIKMA